MSRTEARRYIELLGHYAACVGNVLTAWLCYVALAYLLYAAATWLLAH